MNWSDDEDGKPGIATVLWRIVGIGVVLAIIGAIGAFLDSGG